jgi:hypothetical protein
MSGVLQSNQVLINSLEHLGAVRDKQYVMLERAV